jgi:hypothetical protein
MASLDYCFEPQGDVLKITANVARGWKKLTKGYGFSERIDGQFRGDYRMRIQVDVLRNDYLKRTQEFPKALVGGCESDCLTCSLDGGSLLAKVPLPRNPCWRLSEARNPEIVCQAWPVAAAGHAVCGLKLLIVFFAPQDARPRDIREWDTQFWSGGLPSLGKRS